MLRLLRRAPVAPPRPPPGGSSSLLAVVLVAFVVVLVLLGTVLKRARKSKRLPGEPRKKPADTREDILRSNNRFEAKLRKHSSMTSAEDDAESADDQQRMSQSMQRLPLGKPVEDESGPSVSRQRSAPAAPAAPAAALSLVVHSERLSDCSGSIDDGSGGDGDQDTYDSFVTSSVVTMRSDALLPGTAMAELVQRMAEWRDEFTEKRKGAYDIFWHRKTKKVVLAVVALNTSDGLAFVRACNLEVSMPSGSLCAERNAIGTALAMYPQALREDFRAVAVLSLTGDSPDNLNPLPPCGVCSEWLEKIVEANRNFRIVTFSDQHLRFCNLSAPTSLSGALQKIVYGAEDDTENVSPSTSRRPPPPLASASSSASASFDMMMCQPAREDEHHELSSSSHVIINPTQPTDLAQLKFRRSSFSLLPARSARDVTMSM